MLGHIGTDPRELEHLPGLDADELAVVEIRATAHTAPGAVHNDLVGIVDLDEVCSPCSGLLAGLALRRPALLAVRDRRLSKPLCRWGHRGVARVATDASLEIGEPGFELGDTRLLLGDQPRERGVLLEQLFAGGRLLPGRLRRADE